MIRASVIVLSLWAACKRTQTTGESLTDSAKTVAAQEKLPDCDWCGADEAQENISWQATLAQKDEPGTWITVKGQIFHPDKKTPAKDIVLYLYHTNAKGIYEKKGNETGNGKRHGYLRGWLKSDESGRYEFYNPQARVLSKFNRTGAHSYDD